jgi:hypothetical protein
MPVDPTGARSKFGGKSAFNHEHVEPRNDVCGRGQIGGRNVRLASDGGSRTRGRLCKKKYLKACGKSIDEEDRKIKVLRLGKAWDKLANAAKSPLKNYKVASQIAHGIGNTKKIFDPTKDMPKERFQQIIDGLPKPARNVYEQYKEALETANDSSETCYIEGLDAEIVQAEQSILDFDKEARKSPLEGDLRAYAMAEIVERWADLVSMFGEYLRKPDEGAAKKLRSALNELPKAAADVGGHGQPGVEEVKKKVRHWLDEVKRSHVDSIPTTGGLE